MILTFPKLSKSDAEHVADVVLGSKKVCQTLELALQDEATITELISIMSLVAEDALSEKKRDEKENPDYVEEYFESGGGGA